MTDSVHEVADLLDAFGAALYDRDLEASMDLLSADEQLAVVPSEGVELHRGQAEVRDFMARIYGGPRRYRWTWDNRWISVDGSIASFVAVGTETLEEAGTITLIPYCMTGVARRTPSGWRFSLLHGSQDTAAATPAGRSA